METWREVPGWPGFRASTLGRIWLPEVTAKGRTYNTGPVMGSWTGGRYILRLKGLGRTVKVARLVCLAFHGPPPKGKPYCLHKDENAANNKPGNLKWGTQKENLNAPGFIAYCKSRTGDRWPGRK